MKDNTEQILSEDFEYVYSKNKWHSDCFYKKSVFITGATGLIGSNLAKYLLFLNRHYGTDISIYLLVRNLEKANAVFGDEVCQNQVVLIPADVQDQNLSGMMECHIDYIIHAASETSSRNFVEKPVETIMTAIEGTKNVLSLAKEKKVSGIVYLSSMEVYGISVNDDLIAEKDIGYLDPLEVRSSYSESKKMAENLCISFASEYDVPVKIIRLAQTFGPGVAYDDGRVFAQFARCAIQKKDIVLQTKGETKRTYLYTADAVSAILAVLARGENKNAYNAANMDTYCSIKEMADLVSDKIADGKISVEIHLPDVPNPMYNPFQKLYLDTTKLQALGWQAEVDLEGMYRRMIACMSIQQNW